MANFTDILASRMAARRMQLNQPQGQPGSYPFWTPDLVAPPLPAVMSQLARLGAFRHYGLVGHDFPRMQAPPTIPYNF